jgi:hypothetical protein
MGLPDIRYGNLLIVFGSDKDSRQFHEMANVCVALSPVDKGFQELKDRVFQDAWNVERECLTTFLRIIYPAGLSYDQALDEMQTNSEGMRQYLQWKSDRQEPIRNLILPPQYVSQLCQLKILHGRSWWDIAIFMNKKFPAIVIASVDCALLFDLEQSRDGETWYTGWEKEKASPEDGGRYAPGMEHCIWQQRYSGGG